MITLTNNVKMSYLIFFQCEFLDLEKNNPSTSYIYMSNREVEKLVDKHNTEISIQCPFPPYSVWLQLPS